MKLGLFTDLHTSSNPDRAYGIKKTLELVSSTFEKEGVDAAVNLGDTFNKAYIESIQEMQVFNYYIKLFKKFKNYILIGNHEILESGNLDNSVWDVVKSLNNPNFVLVDNYMTLQTETKRLGLLPFGCEIPKNPLTVLDFLFHHADVEGMRYPTGKVIEAGKNSLNLADGLSKLYVGGHIHVHQEWQNSIYIGSTFPQPFDYIENFNMSKFPSFYIFDTETGRWTRFLNPYPRINLKYSETDDYNKIISDLKSIFKVDDSPFGFEESCKVYIRFLYTSTEYDAGLIERTIKKPFENKDLKIEFFRKIHKEGQSLSQSDSDDTVNINVPKPITKGLEEKVIGLLKEKDPELIKIYEKVKNGT